MKISVACGGTGGHVFPGMAVAGELKSRGHDVTLWLAGKHVKSRGHNVTLPLAGQNVETASAGTWDGRVVTVRAEGFSSGPGMGSAMTVARLVSATFFCFRKMRRSRPDVLFATGSYASVGPAVAARLLGVPIVLHEANVIPGRALKLLSRYASVVAISFDKTRAYLPGRTCILTGFPVREDIGAASSTQRLLPAGIFTALVMGGSQGARRLNEIASGAICLTHGAGHSIQVIHLTGSHDEALVKARYEQAGVPHSVHSFLRDMPRAYGSADFAICRAGAATCAELSASATPALLVPFPFATADHQTANAGALVEAGLADLIAEANLTPERLAGYLGDLMSNPARLALMKSAAQPDAAHEATARIADLIGTEGKKRREGC